MQICFRPSALKTPWAFPLFLCNPVFTFPTTKTTSFSVGHLFSSFSFSFCLFSEPRQLTASDSYLSPHALPQKRKKRMSSESDDPQNKPGLVITVTDSIRSFLLSTSNDSRLSQELRELALTLSSRTNAPYKQIRSIWVGSHADTKPGLISLFSGSNFVFSSPKPREKVKKKI